MAAAYEALCEKDEDNYFQFQLKIQYMQDNLKNYSWVILAEMKVKEGFSHLYLGKSLYKYIK